MTSRSIARRRVQVAAAMVYALFLYVFSPMNLVVIGWFADFEDAISHRVHEVTIGVLFTLGFVGVMGSLRRRDRAAAAIQSVVSLCVAAGVIAASTGFEPLVLAYLIPPVVLAGLDPQWRDIVTMRRPPNATLLVLASLLVSMFGGIALENFAKARDLVQGHESHWGAMAAFAIVVSGLAFVAALRPPGWRLAGWSVVMGVSVYALVSTAFRFDASSLGFYGAGTAILWAVAFVTAMSVSPVEEGAPQMTRRLDGVLVGGVAAAVARQTGWRPWSVRLAFATPVLGPVVYIVLWLAIPADSSGPARRTALIVSIVALVLLVGGTIGVGLPLVIVGLAFNVTVIRLLRRLRLDQRRALTRFAAGVAFSGAAIVAAFLWLAPALAVPVVPHRIDSDARTYCVTCHTNPGVARGAPIIDLGDHAGFGVGGRQCVSCHAHLPAADSTVSASWRLPLDASPGSP